MVPLVKHHRLLGEGVQSCPSRCGVFKAGSQTSKTRLLVWYDQASTWYWAVQYEGDD